MATESTNDSPFHAVTLACSCGCQFTITALGMFDNELDGVGCPMCGEDLVDDCEWDGDEDDLENEDD